MKIIHLLYSIKPGGAENVALNYAKSLRLLGVASIIVGKKENEKYAAVLSEWAEVCNDFHFSIIEPDDVIFVHCNQWLIGLLRFLPILKIKKIRVVYIQHLNYSPRKFFGLSVLINTICTDFIRITPITKALVNKFIFIRKHLIVNFYIQHYRVSEWPRIRESVRKEYDIHSSKTVISFSAIFRPGKGLEDFLKLASNCQDKKNYHFLLIGDGPERYLMEKYKSDNITWVGKVNDVEKFLIASDIYFFASKWEMMPMALIEAIDVDKKIIAYSTELNNFLLNDKTFDRITDPDILNADLPSGKTLIHYDSEYAICQLKKLLNI